MDGPPPIRPTQPRRLGRGPPSGPREPDALEKGHRFGCGALLGGLLIAGVVFSGLFELFEDPARVWMVVGVCATVSGALATRFGDRAFDVLFRLFWWIGW